MIGVWESTEGGSTQPNVVDTVFVKRDGNEWVETWVVDRNGTQVEYEVSFSPSAGGTMFGVSQK